MSDDDSTPPVVQHADDAYEAIRAINHITIDARSMPAPIAYRMLGNLKAMGLQQALTQMGSLLERSLKTHDVYEWEDKDPVASVRDARSHLDNAAALAAQMQVHLAAAQNAIAGQGYRE